MLACSPSSSICSPLLFFSAAYQHSSLFTLLLLLLLLLLISIKAFFLGVCERERACHVRERGGGWQQGEQKNDYAQNPIDLLMCERERATCYMRKLAPLFFFVFFGISHLALCVRAWKNVNELNQGQSRWKKCVENEMREKKNKHKHRTKKPNLTFMAKMTTRTLKTTHGNREKKLLKRFYFLFGPYFCLFTFIVFFSSLLHKIYAKTLKK